MRIREISGSVDNGGWTCKGDLFRDAGSLNYNREISVFTDVYGPLGAVSDFLAFRGHILPDSWVRTFQGSIAGFTAATAQEFMKRNRVQGVFFTEQASPANQHQITDMSYAKIAEHLIGKSGERGHCNLSKVSWPFEGIATLDIDDANSTRIDSYDLKEGNFWTRLVEIAEIDLYYVWVKKNNEIAFRRHPMFELPLANPQIIIEDNEIIEPFEIQPIEIRPGQVRINGTTPNGSQFSGKFPAEPEGGEIYHKSGFVAANNATVAAVAERQYRFDTRTHTAIVNVGGPIGLYLELMDRVQINSASSEDGFLWSNKSFYVHGVNVIFDHETLTATTELTLEAAN